MQGLQTDCIMFGAEFDEQLRVPIEFPGTSDAQVPLYVAAPMVRYSRLTFRRLCRGYNTDVCCTPMIMADSFTRSDKCRKVEWVTEPGDRPLIAQFAANDGKMLADAAELVAGQCDGIDLNCGCPQRWVMAEGYGSCLLKQPDLIADMVSQTRNRLASLAPKVTVSIKIRLALGGLESTVDLCRKTQMAGVDFITIHGRTPKQRCEPVDYDSIATVIRSLEIPVILNGDVTNQVDAQKLAQKTGARGVMAARGLLHNPAMFAGYAVAPETCIKDWVETGIRDGLTFASWHQHLIFMLEKQLRKSDRKVFNALQSFGECIDFLNENLGLGCDWPSLQSLRLSKCSDESGENE